MQKVKIGVFDSGVGGLSVVNAIHNELPDLEIIYKDDKQHVPYGTRSIPQIYDFIKPIFQQFTNEQCRVVVVACNTVTTNLISDLRQEFQFPLVGMEPMVKPAAEKTKTGVIAVCATPRTLSSDRYQWLKAEYANNIKVFEPDCSDWALLIQNNQLNKDKIAKTINQCIKRNADQIVLGCTHYHWIQDVIEDIADGRAEVIQPEDAMIKQLKTVLQQLT